MKAHSGARSKQTGDVFAVELDMARRKQQNEQAEVEKVSGDDLHRIT